MPLGGVLGKPLQGVLGGVRELLLLHLVLEPPLLCLVLEAHELRFFGRLLGALLLALVVLEAGLLLALGVRFDGSLLLVLEGLLQLLCTVVVLYVCRNGHVDRGLQGLIRHEVGRKEARNAPAQSP
jgi:hypothetical protein